MNSKMDGDETVHMPILQNSDCKNQRRLQFTVEESLVIRKQLVSVRGKM